MREWSTYKANQHCPICGHKGWCCYRGPITAPTAVGCARVATGCAKNREGRPITFRGGMGWVHRIRDDGSFHPRRPVRRARQIQPFNPFMDELAREFHANITPLEAHALGELLGVSGASLMRLRLGWCKQYLSREIGEGGEVTEKVAHAKAFAFPMRDAGGKVVGIRFRNLSGYKWAAKGSQNGLFIPAGKLTQGALIVAEGPTETAAVMDWGFDVIGRPGNTAGKEFVIDFCRRHPGKDVVILRNNDPAGSDALRLTHLGADGVAAELLASHFARSVRVMAPPVTKDARDWKKQGATRAEVEAVIRRTPLWRPTEHRPTVATPAHDQGLRARRVA